MLLTLGLGHQFVDPVSESSRIYMMHMSEWFYWYKIAL
jgi:hypothetical protein